MILHRKAATGATFRSKVCARSAACLAARVPDPATNAGKNIIFNNGEDDAKTNLVVPMAGLAAAVVPANNEVELQFAADDTVNRDDEALVEMRLWVPPDHHEFGTAAAAAEPNSKGELPSAAQMLQKKVMKAAGLASVTGDLIAEFDEKSSMFLAPRGRFAIEMYGNYMRLAGKTTEFKVSYSSIARFSYLPKPNPLKSEVDRFCIVISLDDPVKSGQQRHAHLVLQVDKAQHTCVIHADEKTRAADFGGIAAEVTDDLPKVMATVFKHLTGKKVYLPRKFSSALEHKGVKCSLKSSDGLLFPLDKSFMFIHKPATFIRFSEVSTVEFKRLQSTTLDMHVQCRSVGGEPGREFSFIGIDAREKGPLSSFCRDRGLNVIMEASSEMSGLATQSALNAVLGDDDDSEEDDSDFKDGGSVSDGGDSEEGASADGSGDEGAAASGSGGDNSDDGSGSGGSGGGSGSGSESDDGDDDEGLDAEEAALLQAARKGKGSKRSRKEGGSSSGSKKKRA